MIQRYVIRPDRDGYSVCDMCTGEPIVIAMAPQIGLSQEDAEYTAELLNRKAENDDRSVLQ